MYKVLRLFFYFLLNLYMIFVYLILDLWYNVQYFCYFIFSYVWMYGSAKKNCKIHTSLDYIYDLKKRYICIGHIHRN